MTEDESARETDRDREIGYGYRHIDIDIDRRKKKERRFYVPSSFECTFDMLQSILKREKSNFSKWVREQTESYVRLHEPGNPQQRLDTILKIGKAYHAPGRVCGFKDCMRDAIGVAVYIPRNEEYGYCAVHGKTIKDYADLWRVLT